MSVLILSESSICSNANRDLEAYKGPCLEKPTGFEQTKQAPEAAGSVPPKERAWWVPQTLQVSGGSNLR